MRILKSATANQNSPQFQNGDKNSKREISQPLVLSQQVTDVHVSRRANADVCRVQDSLTEFLLLRLGGALS